MRQHDGRPPMVKWWTLTAAVLGTFMLMLDLSVVNIALPVIRRDLNVSFEEVQWVLDAYALTLAVFLLTAGALADAFGRKKLFQIGFGVFVLGSLACGLANSGIALDISRGAAGVGGAVLYAVSPALISREFRGRQRAFAFGVFGAIIGLAVALGPLIGAALITGANWRWIFFLNVPVGIAAIVITAVFVEDSRDPRARGVDLPGFITSALALGALVLALIRAPQDGWTSARIVGLAALALVGFALFIVVERRRGRAAMLDMSLFKSVTFVGLSLAALLAWSVGPVSIFIEVSFAENVLGLTPWQAGVRFLPLTIGIFVAGALAGMLMNKVAVRSLFLVSAAFMGAGMLLVCLASQDSSWLALLPSMIVTGLGMGMFNPPRASAALLVVEPERSGMASGASEAFQQVGVVLGIAAIGSLFQSRVTRQLSGSAVGRQLSAAGVDTHSLGVTIANGGARQITASIPAPLRPAFADTAGSAFSSSMHLCFIVLAAVSVSCGVVSLLFVRMRDLRSEAPEVEALERREVSAE